MGIASGILLTIIGGTISWLASWYYYMKSRPERTSVRSLLSAAHKKSRNTPTNAGAGKSPAVSLRMALELITAFEEGEVYFPELLICARTYAIIGELLHETFQAVEGVGYEAGPTLSPSWLGARDRALKEGLARSKQEIMRRMEQTTPITTQEGRD